MLKIGIIVGSTRPGRNSINVAKWVDDIAQNRTDAQFELIDLADYDLPLLDEPIPASAGVYSKPYTLKWAAKIAEMDGFVFVTPEYNHSIPAALKNAIDFIYGEWNNKAAGFVSFGSAMGVRSVEQLRQIMAELQVADVRAQVMLSLFTDFENFSVFKPNERHIASVNTMLDQVVLWSGALKAIR